MSDGSQQTQDGGLPKQDSTGTLIDQSPPPDSSTSKTTEQETDKFKEKTEDKSEKTLLNQDEKKDGEKKEEAKPGAPEKYEFKAPEGFTLDEKAVEDASKVFKELGLPQEGAQKLIDLYIAKSNEAAQAPYDLWKETQENWVKEIKADPEIGGKLDQVRSTTAKAIDSLGPKLAEQFREAMEFTGAGNNPAFVKAFYNLAQRVTEGGHVSGSGPTKQSQSTTGNAVPSAAEAIYPHLANKG